MKILVITVFPPTRAPEADHAYYLCAQLAAAGCRVHVLTTKGSVSAPHPGVRVHPVMHDWSWRELPHLMRTLQRLQPDAVILLYAGWLYSHHPMITFAPTLAKQMLGEVPFITVFETAYGALVGNTHTRAVRAARKVAAQLAGDQQVHYNFGTLLRDSDAVLALGNEHLQALHQHCATLNGKGALLPIAPLMPLLPADDGLTRQRGRAWLHVRENDFLLAYFGYLYPGKGVETLFRALQRLTPASSHLKLALLGGVLDQRHQDDCSKYVQELRTLAGQLGISDRLIWAGGYELGDERASLFLHAADACALPFDSGVQRNHSSFAAAAAHGLPIISTRTATTADAFKDTENVLLCPPQDPVALATAIQALLTQPELRTQLRRGALQLAEELFSWQHAVQTLLLKCGAKN